MVRLSGPPTPITAFHSSNTARPSSCRHGTPSSTPASTGEGPACGAAPPGGAQDRRNQPQAGAVLLTRALRVTALDAGLSAGLGAVAAGPGGA